MTSTTVTPDAESVGFSLPGVIAAKLRGRELFGHPIGLYILFLTEMWERFSYYGMRALLIMYMTKYLLVDPARAQLVFGFSGLEHLLSAIFGKLSVQAIGSQIYGLYTAFVYFTPFFGGMLADKVWGQHKSVFVGGILMAIGHFLMASERFFLLALLFLILGCGCFKPNISTQVGNLYPEGDNRRDGAFTIFYMGINLGAVFSPLVCGTFGQMVGWDYGFGAAGIGMLLGVIIYWLGSGLVPRGQMMADGSVAKPVKSREEVNKEPLTKQDWRQIWALVILCLFNVAFWAIYEQQGNTLQLWAADRTNWHLLGFNIPSSWYQSFNPAYIIIFAPFLDIFWNWQSKRGKEPSTVIKMGIGCLLCGLAYLIMIAAARIVSPGERGSVMWLATTTWVFTMGELYLSPTGLSLVTKVAPKRLVNTMMGVWFFSYFLGDWFAGDIGMLYNVITKEHFFAFLTTIGVATGFIFFLLKRPLSRSIGTEI